MPSIVPAALTFTGGMLRTGSTVPARLTYTGGTITVLNDTPLTTAAEIPQLNRLQRQGAYFTPGGAPTQQMQLHWQRTMEAIESAFRAVNARVDEVAILARLSAAENLAQAANDNAIAAQEAAAVTSASVSATLTQIDPTYSEYYEETYDRGGIPVN